MLIKWRSRQEAAYTANIGVTTISLWLWHFDGNYDTLVVIMTLWWLMVVMTHWWLLYQQVQKQDNRGQRRPPYMKPIQNNPEQLLYDFYMGRFKSVERAIFIFPIPVQSGLVDSLTWKWKWYVPGELCKECWESKGRYISSVQSTSTRGPVDRVGERGTWRAVQRVLREQGLARSRLLSTRLL